MTQNNDPIATFKQERLDIAAGYKDNAAMKDAAQEWLIQCFRNQYMHNFAWTGRPIIQLPADIIAFQEIVWAVKPDLIIEMGIAHGGSLMLSASLLAVLDYCEAIENGTTIDPKQSRRRVLAVDIDIRAHNRAAIEQHPLGKMIDMIEGSSIEQETVDKVKNAAKGYSKVLLCLDSNHTHDHVIKELEFYAPLVSKGSYCLAFDTVIEDLPDDMFPDRPWKVGDNSKTAVRAYLEKLTSEEVTGADGQRLFFEVDNAMQNKLLVSAIPDGILKRV